MTTRIVWHLEGARKFARRLLVPLADVIAVAFAAYLAIALRLDDLTPGAALLSWLPVILLPMVVRPVVNHVFGLYSHSWRHVSVPELLHVVWSTAAGTMVMLALFVATSIAGSPLATGFPRSFWPAEAMISLLLMGAIRLSPRIVTNWTSVSSANDRRSPAILYGAGEAGAMIAHAAIKQPEAGLRPVAFLDDDASKWGHVHAGVRVQGGLQSLASVAQSTGANVVLITIPSAPGEVVRAIADAGFALGLRVQTIPSLGDMFNGTFQMTAVRPLRMEDLLRRRPVPASVLAALAEDLGDETILVTGAGGSIGSELARQLAVVSPRRLVLLDRAEGPLYDVQRELDGRQRRGELPPSPIEFHVVDITNRIALGRLIEAVRPSVIFHAAAYKHVPIMEVHPSSAVEVNIGGTLSMLEAAEKHGVERFVLVSTDKAVNPTSVMGASKRVAELLVAEFSTRTKKPWVSVRFGNVLGSSGSVVPIFQQQLENGERLTVTHEDMTRYFMTIPEAVHLILQAAAVSRSGDLFVLEMGDPVRIMDLAMDVLRLRGIEPDPARIEFVGMRPGEKMHEQLYYGTEDVEPTAHAKVLRVRNDHRRIMNASATAARLLNLAVSGDPVMLRNALMAAVASSHGNGRRAEDAKPGSGVGVMRPHPYEGRAIMATGRSPKMAQPFQSVRADHPSGVRSR